MNKDSGNRTLYAPAARSSVTEILNERELINTQKLFTEVLGALSGVSAVINENRQIVFANNEFLEILGINSIEPILGKRMGEAISCSHSEWGPSGCGTSEACRYCGAVNVVLESIRNKVRVSREARILTQEDGKVKSWDLKITSAPIKFNDSVFYVLSLQDIGSQKKLQVIERIFFHDLLNAAGGLNGLLTILKMGVNAKELNDLINRSEEVSQVILEEIISYQQIRAAESGDIQIKIEMINSLDLLESSINRIAFHEVGQNKRIEITANSVTIDFETDRLLLQRVLINILKNALEATPDGGLVKVSVVESNNKLIFSVQNEGLIPEKVGMQIFHRFFTTKGKGRGTGTFSVKLLTESYLNGKVSFISNETEGTIFYVELPRLWPQFTA